jgi:hypothetical protein
MNTETNAANVTKPNAKPNAKPKKENVMTAPTTAAPAAPTTLAITASPKRVFNASGAARAIVTMTTLESLRQAADRRGIKIDDRANAEMIALGIIKYENPVVQGHFAGMVIDLTHGEGLALDPHALTNALAAAFPGAGVGPRHGPHYICHARKGRLKGMRDGLPAIPFNRGTRAASTANNPISAVADVPEAAPAPLATAATLMAENDRKTLQDMAKGMDLKAGGSTEEIAQRIADFLNG